MVSIHIIADSPAKVADLRLILASGYSISSALLNDAKAVPADLDTIIVAIDLRRAESISTLRKQILRCRMQCKQIFIVEHGARIQIAQAYALGAKAVLTVPVDQRALLAAVSEGADFQRTNILSGSEAAASAGALAISSMFSDVGSNRPIDVASAEKAAHTIAENIAEDGLSSWLQTVRQHHEGTFQHCLLVIGIAVDFGLCLGIAKADIGRLYSAAMFHDVGKAKIPLAILDKPSRLDREERIVIETHPMAGYTVLKGVVGVSTEILDAVLHHHEYLDGSGYPDGLCDRSISDLVRMLTISDIFAALIEDRRYKPPMSRQQAYDIIRSMRGKLEDPLVAAFREVALTR